MIFFYRLITILLYPIFILIILLRKLKKKNIQKNIKRRYSLIILILKETKKKLLWFHAASVGEVISIIPIIKELNNENSNLDF